MKDRITVVNEKIDYSKNGHRLYWLNTIVVENIKNNIFGISHGVRKTDLPLFLRTGIHIQSYKKYRKKWDKNIIYIFIYSPISKKNLKL